jgi:hypothetical protein
MANRRWKIMGVLAAVAVLCALLLLRSDSNEQKAVEETRRALRQQGYKVDLTEFDFSTSDELRVRVATLTNATSLTAPRTADNFNHLSALLQGTRLLAEGKAVTVIDGPISWRRWARTRLSWSGSRISCQVAPAKITGRRCARH